MITADTYGAGRRRPPARPRAGGRAARGVLRRRRRGPRLLRGRARRPARLSPLHRPAPARPGRLRRLPAHGHRAQPGALRRWTRFDLLLLHNPDRTGYTSEAVWEGMAALRAEGLAGAIGVAPGPANGFTLDLIDCLERFGYGDRLGHAHPQPARAVAGRAGAARRRGAGRARDHPRGGLRRAVLGRPARRARVRQGRPPRLPPRRLDRARARADRPDAPDRRAPRAHPAPARLPVEPRPRGGGVRRAHADPGARRGRPGGGEARGAGGHPRRGGAVRARRWPRSARSATTPAAWR